MLKDKKGVLVVISGPSGAGKSTVIRRVVERRNDIFFSVSVTTRPPRPGEEDGKDYLFISKERFLQMAAAGELLEYAQYVDNFYGTPMEPVDNALAAGYNVLLDIEVQGAAQVLSKRDDAVSVFLCPPSLFALETRLRGRGTDSEERIVQRLLTARSEYKKAENYSYIVVNDDADVAADELNSIVTAARCRMENRIEYILEGVDVL